mgnify:CR=1 FL=1
MLRFLTAIALVSGCAKPVPPAEFPPTFSASDRLAAFFAEVYEHELSSDPNRQAYLGIQDHNDQWTDESESAKRQRLDDAEAALARLRGEFDPASLSPEDQLSYRLFEHNVAQQVADWPYRNHGYPLNQMWGLHSSTPSFLINMHPIGDARDASAYIKRLNGVGSRFDDLLDRLRAAEAAGAVAPAFVHPRVLDDCTNILTGKPFDDSDHDSAILADFRAKVDALQLDPEGRARLIHDAEVALKEQVEPAYREIMAFVEDQATRATTDDGVWKFDPDGTYYARRLEAATTTDMTAEQIHTLGLAEVERIHGEMATIQQAVGFEGELEDFFAFLKEDPQFYFDDSDEGRAAYMARATEIIETMEGRLDELFITTPKSRIIVKQVEGWREKSAGKAFYQSGSPDGERPGIYYANLYNVADMPRYQMEALAYHEGIPGHHMQNSVAMELEGLPEFRKHGHVTAYGEGWGLYTEYIPKEMGLYEDPYSDFGRLAMELWRACRLVVDTGIHHKRWTREQAIAYLQDNTPNSDGDIIKAIERYIVMPGQATAYKIGMIRILALREEARAALGDDFDLREFHDVFLLNGPVPLDILEEIVDRWVASKKS